jgi:hypothetical protein
LYPAAAQLLATILFGLAVLHTFLISRFERIASKFPEGSVGENFFHFMGEVEVVFGLWAGALVALMVITLGPQSAFSYVESLNFSEPLFVFAIMTVASTRPIISLASSLILLISRLIPLHREIATYISCLVIGPILGSFITEPAAMTVTALILRDRYFLSNTSEKFKYLTLGALFVNVSIGGVLTPFAAPPVLMVAEKWNWGMHFMLSQFGWKAVIGTLINSMIVSWVVKKELRKLKIEKQRLVRKKVPWWLTVLHVIFMFLIVMTVHHPIIFVGLFLFFIGVAAISREYQDELKLREGLLVAFFLGGLVILGGLQDWWLKPLIKGLNTFPLFLGATALTAITDNAALTFLGSQVEGISASFKYALVAGAVSGGGLTVIANAPNPAGFAILQDCFGTEGISPIKLLKAAALPTLVAMICFWFFP